MSAEKEEIELSKRYAEAWRELTGEGAGHHINSRTSEGQLKRVKKNFDAGREEGKISTETAEYMNQVYMGLLHEFSNFPKEPAGDKVKQN